MAGIFRPYDVMQDYHNIDFIKVATDTLQNGHAVVADALTTGTTSGLINGEGALYTPVKPGAVTDANIAIVCAEEYYQDTMGNRLEINDPTVITFTTGQRIRILRPVVNKKYFMSNDLITGTVAVGKYLVPTATEYGWTIADDLTGNPKTAFKVEAKDVKDTFVGLGYVLGARIRCVRAQGE